MFEKAYCFCLPHLINIGIALAFFVASYIIYRILFTVLLRMAKTELFRIVIKGIKKPLFWFFMEEAAFATIYLFDFNDKITTFLISIVLVLLVVNVGWIAIRTIRLLFHHTIAAYKKDPNRKSSVIQLQFVYRMLVIIVAILTIGGILVLFPSAKHLGVGLLGSAGIVGLVIGMAARPIFLNLMAGLQIAITKTINLDDAVVIEGDFGRIESIHLTYVVVRTWDLKRNIIPISQFIDKSFQNMDMKSKEKLGSVFLYVDYQMSVDLLRAKFAELVESSPLYNGTVYKLHVVEMTEQTMQIRLIMTGDDAPSTFELRCFIREKLIEFLQKEHPAALPVVREVQKEEV